MPGMPVASTSSSSTHVVPPSCPPALPSPELQTLITSVTQKELDYFHRMPPQDKALVGKKLPATSDRLEALGEQLVLIQNLGHGTGCCIGKDPLDVFVRNAASAVERGARLYRHLPALPALEWLELEHSPAVPLPVMAQLPVYSLYCNAVLPDDGHADMPLQHAAQLLTLVTQPASTR
ncbi:hypothetical protein NSY55_26520 [Pseudomonas aeruginosa]|nr:hypothetical protein [Pseudomonas aeruginosa]